MLPGEQTWLAAVVANLSDDTTKLVYADWLQEQGDNARAAFLRKFVAAVLSAQVADYPEPEPEFSEEWLELIGFRLLHSLAQAGRFELNERVLKLARPALRMVQSPLEDTEFRIGASKIGGLPDLPFGFEWPEGKECRAIYNDDTAHVKRLAGFVAQVNFAEIARTQATKGLPKAGLLSFFCFQDIPNDKPDVIGVKAIWFPDPTGFIDTEPPRKQTQGNQVMPSESLVFEETLDLPAQWSGPWEGELGEGEDKALSDHVYSLNFKNMLGYARSTSGGDPTPSKEYRHLILLKNDAGCRLHIQIHQKDLDALNFDNIKLAWVDFD